MEPKFGTWAQPAPFGGGAGDTFLHPLVAVVMVVAIILILCLPRKHVIVPLLLCLFCIPKGQVMVIASLHFTVFRILLLTALARLAAGGQSSSIAKGYNSIDRVVTLWAFSLMIVYSLQWMALPALIKCLGELIDSLGSYYILRYLIQDWEDVRRAIKVLVLVSLVMAVCMMNEQRTGANIFGWLGGVPPETIRDGKIRSQGAFEVEITAGVFGATLLPLTVLLWSDGRYRVIAFLGMVGATIMTLTCYASTAMMAFVAGILGLCFWPIRKGMRLLRWGLVGTLVALHLVMHGPVWSLIEHIDLTGSSSSFHRFQLVDNCIRHFGDWWLLGTRDNGSWGWFMWDTSNQYVAYAFTGGLSTFILFISIISLSFSRLGAARKIVESDRKAAWILWCLGATILAHVVGFFGIGYFDQVQFAWFTLLAIIPVAISNVIKAPSLQGQASIPDFQTEEAICESALDKSVRTGAPLTPWSRYETE
jgi:hypothetical protein